MQMVDSFSNWLQGTNLAWAVIAYPWIWPTCETLHFLGLVLLVGTVGLIDARMLGLVKELPLGHLQRLLPWGILGFVINLITGFLFFAGNSSMYNHNVAFWMKLLFIVLAGINAILFYLTGLSRNIDRLGPGEDASPPAKVVAAVSLFLWFGIIYWGRMLPFVTMRL